MLEEPSKFGLSLKSQPIPLYVQLGTSTYPVIFGGLLFWYSTSSTVHTAPFTFSTRTKHLCRLRLWRTAFCRREDKEERTVCKQITRFYKGRRYSNRKYSMLRHGFKKREGERETDIERVTSLIKKDMLEEEKARMWIIQFLLHYIYHFLQRSIFNFKTS